VLVVDVHALEPVDLLDLVDQERLQLARALDLEDFVRVHGAVVNLLALGDEVAVLYPEEL